MVIWHAKKTKKKSGGRIRPHRKKRKFELGRISILTKVGEEEKRIKIRTKGGGEKIKAITAQWVNVHVNGKTQKVKILTVVENPANPHYVRRNLITKGAIVKTELGLVRITSRPSQHGILNGVLIEKSK